MTRDFAKNKRPSANGKRSSSAPKKSSARQSRRGAAKPATPSGRQVPGWVWLLTGAMLGAFVMFLVYLSDLPSTHSARTKEPTTNTANQQTVPKPRFDFYKLLKETEVPIQDTTLPAPSHRDTQPRQEYILQVGSFKASADADRLRAQLILMNLETQVEKVTVRNGQVWHRVLVGPYQSRSKVAKARSVLVSNNINPLLLKRKQP